MAGIGRFEDIEAWKAARHLTNEIYEVTTEGLLAKDYGLKDQIQRAASSTMANIAEGFDSGSDREFIRFLRYTIRSASELQSHLYIGLDRKYINQKQFDILYELAGKVKKLTAGLIRYLRSETDS